jgi:hypothetical protein
MNKEEKEHETGRVSYRAVFSVVSSGVSLMLGVAFFRW